MQKIQCEVCGSNELTKQGDFFVCDYCGCKYTAESIRSQIVTNNITNNIKSLHTDNLYMVSEKEFEITGGKLKKYKGESENVIIPDNVTEIGELAFSGIPLKTITIPGSVKRIGSCAFDGCKGLTDLNLSQVEVIGSEAFRECTGIKSINLPKSISTIEPRCFKGCELNEITVDMITEDFNLDFLFGCKVINLHLPNKMIFKSSHSLKTNICYNNSIHYDKMNIKNVYLSENTQLKDAMNLLFYDTVENVYCGKNDIFDYISVNSSFTHLRGYKEYAVSTKILISGDLFLEIPYIYDTISKQFANYSDIGVNKTPKKILQMIRSQHEEIKNEISEDIANAKRNHLCLHCGAKLPMMARICKNCGMSKDSLRIL